ncbi:hypothetical protein EMPG_14171 [Blastomyces silverae]|uniref:Uncharacterized protein n=1 Tax=Blastomyces silverae TaxID=2060906 RepID=A0A0H1BMR6_9EURO|nr:hypothetical protein EMPG_14171 [Blastomyces silverae]
MEFFDQLSPESGRSAVANIVDEGHLLIKFFNTESQSKKRTMPSAGPASQENHGKRRRRH